MKKMLLTSVIILVFAVTGSAQTKMAGYLGGGVNMPMSPDVFKDENKMGIGFFGSFGAEVNPMFEILGRVGYNMYSVDEEGIEATFTAMVEAYGYTVDEFSLDGGKIKMIEFGVDVKFKIPMGETGSAFQPYLVAGPGMVNLSRDDVTVSFTITDPLGGSADTTDVLVTEGVTKFGANFGAGFTYLFTPTVGAFVDARYAMIFTEGETTAYLPIRGGVAFLFGGTGE